jgi:hypothetical protein
MSRRPRVSMANLTKAQQRSGTLTALYGGLTSCDFTQGCTDDGCERCRLPGDPRDVEVKQWLAVWAVR